MTWNGSDLMLSVGNTMPESYYEQGRADFEQLVNDVDFTARHWSDLLGKDVTVDVSEFSGVSQYWLSVRVAGFGSMRFASLFEMETFFERMFPGGEA